MTNNPYVEPGTQTTALWHVSDMLTALVALDRIVEDNVSASAALSLNKAAIAIASAMIECQYAYRRHITNQDEAEASDGR